MIEEHIGDILKSGAGAVCQQVNCRGAMNSGLAKYIKTKYPVVAEEYKARVAQAKQDSRDLEDYGLLGRVQAVEVAPKQVILNLFSQNHYGKDGKQYTDYPALQVCLDTIRDYVELGVRIAFPYNLGCGLGGGDWSTVRKMIEKTFQNRRVEIWRLPNAR